MNRRIKITSDALCICQRLKLIDPSYYVLLNLDTQKFEIHSNEQYENSYCFTLPYDQLDSRALDYALKTRSQNLDEIIAEMDRQNQLLSKSLKKDVLNKIQEVLQ